MQKQTHLLDVETDVKVPVRVNHPKTSPYNMSKISARSVKSTLGNECKALAL